MYLAYALYHCIAVFLVYVILLIIDTKNIVLITNLLQILKFK